jgi:calcineurin-like phosphoesterase family protein
MTLWLISDLHLFHANLLRGGKIGIRPFDTLAEMHETIVERWNSVVKPNDKVYMLGDLTLERPAKAMDLLLEQVRRFEIFMNRLHGKKRLVLGNHDHFPVHFYGAIGFEKVLGSREMAGLVFTHYPVYAAALGDEYRYKGNVHGHVHANSVMDNYVDRFGIDQCVPDTRYVNVCVEAVNYTPISLEECVQRVGG